MRKKYSQRHRRPAELLLVPMIDIFTVLVTFLLMTAVFSRISIVELDLPSSRGEKVTEPAFRLEVILRKDGYEVTNGKDRIAAVPKVNGAYDLQTLSQLAISLKRDHQDVNNASVLLEPDIDYDSLIHVMDAVRTTDVPVGPNAQPTKVALFEDIAVGDAP